MTDVLILGGITFNNSDYSPPTKMPFGGEQSMVVHKLPGGSRVVDTLGPDEDDTSWNGFFFTPNALQICQQLDGMRASGVPVSLSFGGMFRSVVVKSFKSSIKRYPNWVEYNISCLVVSNPSLGVLGGGISTVDILIASDLATALTAALQ
jgi:hypothetical protein